MYEQDKEALLFLEAVPVHPKVIGRGELSKRLGISRSELSSLIYRLSWYLPIAEEDYLGLCWSDQSMKDKVRDDLEHHRVRWIDTAPRAASALRKRML